MHECSIKRGKTNNVTNSGRIKSLEDLLIFVVIVMMFVPEGRRIFNCEFARDVMAAMLMIKNKSISLLLDTKIHSHAKCSRKWPPSHVIANKELPD